MKKPLFVIACLLTAAALPAGTASAASPGRLDPPPDPSNRAIVHERAVIGVGSDTTETLFERLAADFNRASGWSTPLGSWRATGGSPITTKAGCEPIERPNGSSAGIVALVTRQVLPSGRACIDFARSLAPRTTGAPPQSVFLPVAGDAITYAHNAISNVPRALTVDQLRAVIECRATRWDQVGGTSTETIEIFLPEVGPGLLALLRGMAGVTVIGSCVRTVQQDQGTDPVLVGNRNAMVFYSVGKYIGQAVYGHSDVHGDLILGRIDGLPAMVFNPSTRRVEVNAGQVRGVPGALESFRIIEYVVVLRDSTGAVPPALRRLFAGPDSWLCTSRAARDAIADHGFLPLDRSTCGQPS